MEDAFLLVVCLFILFIMNMIAGFFITVDFLFYIFCKKRISKIFRLPAEIMVLCCAPAVFLFWGSMGDQVKDITTTNGLTIIYILMLIAYFASSYTRRIFPILVEITLTTCILGGIFIISLFVATSGNNIRYILLGSSPLLFLLIIATIQQYRRCKESLQLKETLN